MDHFEDKLKSFEPRKPSGEQREHILGNAPVTEMKAEEVMETSGRGRSAVLFALATSRWFLFAVLPLLVLASVGVCAVKFEGYGASRHSRNVMEMLEAAGEKLDLESLYPEPVPDVDNFMATPALRGIENMSHPRGLAIEAKHERIAALPRIRFPKNSEPDQPIDIGALAIYDKNDERSEAPLSSTLSKSPEEELLRAVNTDAALWDELASAALRPHSQPATSIADRLDGGFVWALSAGHLSVLQNLVKLGSLRAVAAARLGDREVARESLAICFKCRAGAAADASLISGLVSVALTAIIEHKLPDILRADCLNADDLDWLQEEVAALDGIALGLRMFRSELAYTARAYDQMLAVPRAERGELLRSIGVGGGAGQNPESVVSYLLPATFFTRNKANSLDWWYRLNLKPLKELDFAAMRGAPEEFSRLQVNTGWFSYGSALAKQSFQDPGKMTSRVISTEMHRRLMVTAVALERYRLVRGEFPATLGALIPDYLDELPIDLPAEFEEGTPPKILSYEPAPDGSAYNLRATPLFPGEERDVSSLQFRR